MVDVKELEVSSEVTLKLSLILSLIEHKEDAAVWYSSPVPCGIIQPHSPVEIPFTLEAQAIGRQDTMASVSVFGNERSPLVSARRDACLCVTHLGGHKVYRGSAREKENVIICGWCGHGKKGFMA